MLPVVERRGLWFLFSISYGASSSVYLNLCHSEAFGIWIFFVIIRDVLTLVWIFRAQSKWTLR